MTIRNILSLTLILRQTSFEREEFKRKPSIQSFARALPLMSCVLIQLPHSNVNIDCGGGEDYLQCQLLTTRGRKFKFTSKTGQRSQCGSEKPTQTETEYIHHQFQTINLYCATRELHTHKKSMLKRELSSISGRTHEPALRTVYCTV